jgi:hypothetical protein
MPERYSLLTEIFPGLSPEELEEADEKLRRYLVFIVRLHERIMADPKERERFLALTEKLRLHRMEAGRTFTSEYIDTEA